MKQICLTILAICLIAAIVIAATNEVTSVNVVGYVKKTFPTNQWVLTTCNFDPIGGGTNTLTDIFGTNQLNVNNNIAKCDRVYVWNVTGQTYQAWAYWTNGGLYKANSVSEWNTLTAGDPELLPGVAFWVVPGSLATNNRELVAMGQVVDTVTQSMNIVSSYQMIAYPFSSDIALQNTDFANDGATKKNNVALCDRVMVWLGNSYQAYGLWTNGLWYKANTVSEWNQNILASNTLQLAEGFWYVGHTNIVWSETNKYLNNL